MLHRPTDAASDVQVGAHDLAGLAHLVLVGDVAGVDRSAGCAHSRAQGVGQFADDLETGLGVFGHATAAGNNDIGVDQANLARFCSLDLLYFHPAIHRSRRDVHDISAGASGFGRGCSPRAERGKLDGPSGSGIYQDVAGIDGAKPHKLGFVPNTQIQTIGQHANMTVKAHCRHQVPAIASVAGQKCVRLRLRQHVADVGGIKIEIEQRPAGIVDHKNSFRAARACFCGHIVHILADDQSCHPSGQTERLTQRFPTTGDSSAAIGFDEY